MSTYTQAAREYWEAEIADRAALVSGDTVLTYAEWSLRANQLADGLEALAPEVQRVCVVTGTRIEWFVTNLALAKLQWDQVSVDGGSTTAELCAAITATRASIVVTDIDDVAGLRAGLADPGVQVVSLGEAPPGTISFASLQTDPRPTSRITRRGPRFISFTSASKTPKEVRQVPGEAAPERRQWLEIARGTQRDFRARRGAAGVHRALNTLPLSHGSGPTGARLCHSDGGTCYLLDPFDPVEALGLIQRHRITHWTALPMQLQQIRALDEEVLGSFDVSSIRMLAVGGTTVPMSLKRWALSYFGEYLYEVFGTPEAGLITIMEPSKHLTKPGSSGELRPRVSLRVMGSDGAEQPVGSVGELLVRTPLTTAPYPEESPVKADGGYLNIGYMGRIDEDGFVYVLGRSQDVVVRDGVTIAPAEIEAALGEHPEVVEAAVVATPDAEKGSRVTAFVETRPGAAVDDATLNDFLSSNLDKARQPDAINVMAQLPRNAMAKPPIVALREMA